MGLKQDKYPSTFFGEWVFILWDGVLPCHYRVFRGGPFLVLPTVPARVLALATQSFFI